MRLVNRLTEILCVLRALRGKAFLRDLRSRSQRSLRLKAFDLSAFIRENPRRSFLYREIPELSCFPVFTAQAMRGVLCAIPNLPRASSKIIPP